MGGRWVYGPGFGFFGGLLWVAVFAAFIGLAAWAVYTLIRHEHRTAGQTGPFPPGVPPRGPFPPGPPVPPPGWTMHHDDALNTARVRYARGEIDREAYFRVVEDLTGVPRPVAAAPFASPFPSASPTPAPGPVGPAVAPGSPLPRPEWNPGSNPGWPPPAPPGAGYPGGSVPGGSVPGPNPGAAGPSAIPSRPEAGGPEG